MKVLDRQASLNMSQEDRVDLAIEALIMAASQLRSLRASLSGSEGALPKHLALKLPMVRDWLSDTIELIEIVERTREPR
jgi:hypothetical protein